MNSAGAVDTFEDPVLLAGSELQEIVGDIAQLKMIRVRITVSF